MDKDLQLLINALYARCGLQLSQFQTAQEGKAYKACHYRVNEHRVISRKAKITAKKTGLFVSVWKRNHSGETCPHDAGDPLDFLSITVRDGERIGQFIFSKTALVQHQIISVNSKGGKRGFRVYPPWVKTDNAQATKTQQWQEQFFFELGTSNAQERIVKLFNSTSLDE